MLPVSYDNRKEYFRVIEQPQGRRVVGRSLGC